MIKADIIRSIEVQLGLSHEEATVQVEQILTILKDQLTGDDPVLISGFGQWKVRSKRARAKANGKRLGRPKVDSEVEEAIRDALKRGDKGTGGRSPPKCH